MYKVEGYPDSMALDTPVGSLVVFHGVGGYTVENHLAKQFLKVGQTYTVQGLNVGGWSSTVYLKEVSTMGFNTVLFSNVGKK